MWRRRVSLGAVVLAASVACQSRDTSQSTPGPEPRTARSAKGAHAEELGELLAFERRLRSERDFAAVPVPSALHGADPFAAIAVGAGRYAGILRGVDRLQLFDAEQSFSVIDTPPGPTALIRDHRGTLWVGGTGSSRIAGYRLAASGLEAIGEVQVPGTFTARALASAGSWLYVADQRTGQISAARLAGDTEPTIDRTVLLGSCHGPVELSVAPGQLAAVCVGDRSLALFELHDDGSPGMGEPQLIRHDGPLWTARLIAGGPGPVRYVVAGGVEDHPLERADGGFRYIDSFLFVYQLEPGLPPRPVAAINVSDHGVVTPKWLSAELHGGAVHVTTAGYGSAVLLDATIPLEPFAQPTITSRDWVPGTTGWIELEGGGALAANPLFDSWIWLEKGGLHRTPIAAADQPERSWHSRLGEALLFTTAMAPWNPSAGPNSRFTCETCHFEAYGDGRTHYTGRGDVHAVTKPLRGLFNNAPHFSRALDRTTSRMVHAEFRVANRFSGRSSWFALDRTDVPWLAELGVPDPVSPVELRRALILYLAELGFDTNQAVRGRSRFSATELQGAELFRDRCASCHDARLVTEDAGSAVPFNRWADHVFSDNGPIVWASAEYRRTGIEPYVHARGTRTPSLRRIHGKWPYFTNGSGRSLRQVVEQTRWKDGNFLHAGDGDRALSRAEVDAVLAFLELL